MADISDKQLVTLWRSRGDGARLAAATFAIFGRCRWLIATAHTRARFNDRCCSHRTRFWNGHRCRSDQTFVISRVDSVLELSNEQYCVKHYRWRISGGKSTYITTRPSTFSAVSVRHVDLIGDTFHAGCSAGTDHRKFQFVFGSIVGDIKRGEHRTGAVQFTDGFQIVSRRIIIALGVSSGRAYHGQFLSCFIA